MNFYFPETAFFVFSALKGLVSSLYASSVS